MINNTNIEECCFFVPKIYPDNRGVFSELYKSSLLDLFKPVQCNCSISKYGVLRGIHRTPYAKLVTCVSGRIYDVCVDLRPNSSTYQQHFAIELNSKNLMSLYIPSYCGHGFLALEDSIVIYHQDQEYDSKTDESYCYKNYNINWPNNPLIVSEKDSLICNGKHIS